MRVGISQLGSSTGLTDCPQALGGDVEFDFLTRWFNGTYAVSVVLAVLLVYAVRRARTDSVACTNWKTSRD